MPRHQRKESIPKTKLMEFSNFFPLIVCIRADLGPDWGFYQEFLEGVMGAADRGEDTSAWYEQAETLVGEQAGLRFSHKGVCFLLRGLEVKAREGLLAPTNDEVNASQPNSKPMQRDVSTELTPLPTLTPNMACPPTAHTNPQASANTTNHGSDVTLLGPSIPLKKPVSALKKHATDPRFFTDDAFKRDIHHHFYANDTNNTNRIKPDQRKNIAHVRDGSLRAPPYFAKDDDLKVWKKRIEDGGEVKVHVNADTASDNSKRGGCEIPGHHGKSVNAFPVEILRK
ncbi:hypothetical protein T440DRAFT_534525 [Plenodomus tracheiphilus IPT5]|uniref:Uncharacterized protein n=1 Tax=Plenodomus tracheiphilus IPT5 TaxID=1408161 RepID=A0A6A7B3K8_9PLEO|nr:hypothetical protein T440DRAFT_534525 [Plenodomus tracheiphilus IPT5]